MKEIIACMQSWPSGISQMVVVCSDAVHGHPHLGHTIFFAWVDDFQDLSLAKVIMCACMGPAYCHKGVICNKQMIIASMNETG